MQSKTQILHLMCKHSRIANCQTEGHFKHYMYMYMYIYTLGRLAQVHVHCHTCTIGGNIYGFDMTPKTTLQTELLPSSVAAAVSDDQDNQTRS